MAKWEAAPVNAVNAMMKTLVPITQDRGQDQQHHHTAAGADETADEADQHTAYQRLDGSFLRGDALHGFLGGHYGTDDEFDT